MIRGQRRAAAFAAASLPLFANAHAFGERYDLPAPLGYFVAGAAATVALSFLVAIAAVRRPRSGSSTDLSIPLGSLGSIVHALIRAVGFALFLLVLIAGLFGDPHPAKNVAPTLAWIIGWVGLSLFVALVGNFWPSIDPWRTLFDGIDAIARGCGRSGGIALDRRWSDRVGGAPAVAFFLIFAGVEVVDPGASRPARIAALALAWTLVNVGGMVAFGRERWQRHADPLALYFETLGRFAPLACDAAAKRLVLRPWGRALVAAPNTAPVAFLIAMLSTVLFDGLMGTQVWRVIDTAFGSWAPRWHDREGVLLGTLGLIGTWLACLAAYHTACALTARLAGGHSPSEVARLFVSTLVPIAVAYLVAHNHAYLLVQGQGIVALLSDPLGRGWNLFGTAAFTPNVGIIDARLTWYIATVAIVTGHVISVWLGHRVALGAWSSRRGAILASIPLTGLMVAYTAVSLTVIADPLTRFRKPDESYSQAGAWPSEFAGPGLDA